MPNKGPLRSRQPGKAIWTVFTILSLFVRLPFIFVYFLPKTLRPHSGWTYRQAVANEISKLYFNYASTVEIGTPRSLEPGPDEGRFALMPPATQNLYQGVLNDKHIRPTVVGGVWLPGPYDTTRKERTKVVLHFHGGAYVILSPRDPNATWGPDKISKEISATVLCPQYRLSSNPDGRFPAALQDALTSYKYLLDLGIPVAQIILSGDSAGAHLVISLLRYLADSHALLPSPSCALLWSPWVDLSAHPQDIDHHQNSKSDYVTSVFLEWGKRLFVPSSLPITHPYISPLGHPFATNVPIWIQVGQAEVLYNEGIQFMKNMSGISGNRIGLHEVPNAPHDIFAAGGTLGFEREWMEALASAEQFLNEQGVHI